MFVIKQLVCLSVLYKRCVGANSLAETGRPVSAVATSSSHIADPATLKLTSLAQACKPTICLKIHRTRPNRTSPAATTTVLSPPLDPDMWHCHRPGGAEFTPGWLRMSCAITARLALATQQNGAPAPDPHIFWTDYVQTAAVPRSASASRNPGAVCAGKTAAGRPGAAERSVTAYLQRKSFCCGPCLFHDPAQMIVSLTETAGRR